MNGQDLSRCFSVVASCGNEIEAMFDALEQIVIEELEDRTLPCILIGDESRRDERKSDYDWVVTDYAYSFALQRRGKKGRAKPEAYLSFQLSLTGDGVEIPGFESPEPLVHVSLDDNEFDFEEYYTGFPLDETEGTVLADDWLLLTPGEDKDSWHGRNWTFSFRLMSLNSVDDLRNKLVQPVLDLLRHDDAKGPWPRPGGEGLVTYASDVGLFSSPEE